MNKNGYINATKFCADVTTRNGKKKEFFHWKANGSSKYILNSLSNKLNISISKLMIIKTGGKKTTIRGTYVHPALLTSIALWMSCEFNGNVCCWIEEWKKSSNDNTNKYFNKLAKSKPDFNNDREKQIQKILKKSLNGKIEVEVPAGYIDILTKKSVVEIKHYDDWICAIGQLMVYSTYYPKKNRTLYLFDVGDKDISIIEDMCNKYDIQLVIYD